MIRVVAFFLLLLPGLIFGQTANSLIDQAAKLENENRWVEAIDAYKKVIDGFGDQLLPLQKANIYNSLGLLHFDLLNPDKSEYYLNLSIAFHEDNGIPDQVAYATALKNLGVLFIERGEYDLAKDYLEKSIAIYEEKEGKRSVDYAIARCDLAELYEEVGYYGLAYDIFSESLDILKENDDRLSPEYATVCQHMGEIMFLNGRSREATEFINESTAIYKRLGANYDVPRAEALEDLGKFYEDMGRFGEAEEKLLEALKLKQSIPGEAEILLIEILNDLGVLYLNTRDYKRSEELFQQVIDKTETHLGKDHRFYATANNNMGTIATALGDLDRAKMHLTTALETYEKRYGHNHPLSANTLNNLARVERAMGNIPQAEMYYKRVLEIDEQLHGKNNPDYATTLINLAILYTSVGEDEQAEPYYLQARQIRKDVLGVDHPAYFSILRFLGLHYLTKGNKIQAEATFRESIELRLKHLNTVFPAFTEQEKIKFYKEVRDEIDRYNYLALDLLNQRPELVKNILDFQIKTKAILLSSSERLRDQIINGTDEALKNQYTTWKQKKSDLATYYQMGQQVLADRNINLQAEENRVEKMEKELVLKIKDFDNVLPGEDKNWRAAWSKLGNDESYVEMVRIREFTANKLGGATIFGFTDFTQYLAIVLTPSNATPQFVILGDDFRTEDAHFAQYRNSMVYGVDQTETFEKYWQPIHELVRGSKRVWMSPDGIFYKMNPNAFRMPGEKFVIDEYFVNYLTNAKDLFREPLELNTGRKVSLFGNPVFGVIPDMNLPNLPGAEEEVKQISKMFRNDWKSQTFVQDEASELRLRSAFNPTILHLATHGFFGRNNRFIASLLPENNPLFASGLILTGVDRTYRQFNQGLATEPENDGILTAQEASNLDLTQTELVVLSACETGLGDIKNGEGVYGLQRAFMTAGARHLVTSLSKVEDQATSELMQAFYERYLKSNKIGVAFEEAQREMRNKYNEPKVWGSFILIGKG